MKLGERGHVLLASHGTKPLSFEEVFILLYYFIFFYFIFFISFLSFFILFSFSSFFLFSFFFLYSLSFLSFLKRKKDFSKELTNIKKDSKKV